MKTKKMLPILLITLFFISIIPVNAANNEFIVPYNTPNTITPDFVYCLHTPNTANEIENMLSSQEFQNYLQKNRINKDEYNLQMVSPYSNAPNKIMIHNTTHKWYYTITNTNQKKGDHDDTPNYFTIHNECGQTVYWVRAALYRIVKDIPVDIHVIDRNNVPNGGQLVYRPDPEFTHVTLRFRPTSDYPGNVAKLAIPLGSWHHAYMSRSAGSGFFWRF